MRGLQLYSVSDWGWVARLSTALSLVVAALLFSGGLSPAVAEGSGLGHQAGLPSLIRVQDDVPVEKRFQVALKGLYKDVRRSFKRSRYFVFNSPTWWWRRAKRSVFPIVFALGALLFDASLLAAWKNDGMRVLTAYIPMMVYVYGRLFFSSRASVVARVAVVLAIVYGVWRHDLIRDGRWSSLGIHRLDDFLIIVAAVRFFVYSCSEELVQAYAGRAIELRNRVLNATGSQAAG